MRYKKHLLTAVFIIAGYAFILKAEPVIKGDFVIFPSYTGSVVYDEILKQSESSLLDLCYKAGRLVPVEYNYRKAAIERSEGSDRDSLYRNAALRLKADIYAVIASYSQNGEYILKLNLYPLNDKYKNLAFEKIIRSRAPENLPLKASMEFASILKTVSLKCEVMEVRNDGTALISAGQWHGLEIGNYTAVEGRIRIKNVTRYTAEAEGINFNAVSSVNFHILPDLDDYIDQNRRSIVENTVRLYGTDEFFEKRDGSIRESLKGTCVISQGANFCLPGYGSFLSVEYMGLENAKPDYAGIFITASLTAAHLALVPVLTDYEANFFPWEEDPDRSDRMERLNYYAWGTIPLTFTASFFSQLSYSYSRMNKLPPQFADYNTSAAVVSVFMPGGGMFYKGYRWTGWGVYVTELVMAGYAVYTDDRDLRYKLAGSLAAVKCAEIIISYFIKPSYSCFNRETASSGGLDFSIGLNRGSTGREEFTAALVYRY